jgi:plastocyanin
MTARARVPAWAAVFLVAGPIAVAAQSVLQRTPNLSGGWDGTRGTLYFNFLHRFTVGGPPARQVANYPTFLLGAGLPGNVLLAVNYATRSDLVEPVYPNEWEFFARAMPLRQFSGFPFDVALQGGYNLAAESLDGELSLNRQLGPIRVLGAARAMSRGYGRDSARFALAGGASLQILRWFALAGDVAQLVDASDAEKTAWGAALQIAIPYTPHTLSLQVTNTNTLTLQGASRGSSTRRYGFEFTIPFHPSRYFGRPAATAAQTAGAEASAAIGSGPTVRVRMRNLAFEPAELRISAGTTVTWLNEDQLMHTVKAADASWESTEIQPGGSWRRTFDRAGRFEITCGPHPFMKQIVEVR